MLYSSLVRSGVTPPNQIQLTPDAFIRSACNDWASWTIFGNHTCSIAGTGNCDDGFGIQVDRCHAGSMRDCCGYVCSVLLGAETELLIKSQCQLLYELRF